MFSAKPKPVILESPFRGNIEHNLRYARRALRDCLLRNEAPYASHLLYTQPGVLDDNIESERFLGIECGFSWRTLAAYTVFYIDLNWSDGMLLAKSHCHLHKTPYETRVIGDPDSGIYRESMVVSSWSPETGLVIKI